MVAELQAVSGDRGPDRVMTGTDPPQVNPRRITMALDMAGAEGPEVDIACGAAEPAVDNWEAGIEVPTARQLELLAEYTGMQVEFFHLPDPPEIDWIAICQRSGKGKGCTLIQDGVVVDSPELARKRRPEARLAAKAEETAKVPELLVPMPEGFRPRGSGGG